MLVLEVFIFDYIYINNGILKGRDNLITLENAKVALKGKWLSIKVVGKSNTKVKAKDLYVDSNVDMHNSVLNYYDSLIKENKNSSLAMLKGILSEKSVSAFYLKNDVLKLYLDKEPMFFNKKPEITVALYSPDIKDNKEELLKFSYSNYNDSRYQFLDEAIENQSVNFIINTKSDISAYDKKENNYVFNLSDIPQFLYNDKEKEFLISIIERILSKANETCYVNYGPVIATKNNGSYFVKDLIIELSDKIIKIDLIDDEEFETIMNLIYTHNNKIEDSYSKKMKERRFCNE